MVRIKILEVEYNEFQGFMVSRIKRLVMTITEVLQILNSTNGSGKTTFISELNPFSINKEMFNKGGYKRIVFEVDGVRYEVYSDHKTNKLINLETGENLNDGGTITQHTSVVERIFKVTPYQWSISMGGLEFTKQDKNGRRKWIEAISGVDFSYAFETYDRLVKAISGTKQALKIVNNDLVGAEERQLPESEVVVLQGEHDELTDAITNLLRAIPNSTQDAGDLHRRVKAIKEAGADIYTALKRKRNKLTDLGVRSWNEADTKIADYREQINRLRGAEDLIVEAIKKHETLLDKVNNNTITKEEVTERLAKVEQELVEVRTEVTSNKVEWLPSVSCVEDARTLQNSLKAVDGFIDDLVASGLTNVGTQSSVNIDEYRNAVNDTDMANREIKLLKAQVAEYEEHIREIESGGTVTCPMCKHAFVDGTDKLDTLNRRLDTHLARINTLEHQIAAVSGTIADYETAEANLNAVKDKSRVLGDDISYAVTSRLETGHSVNSLLPDLKKAKRLVTLYISGFKLKDEQTQYLAAQATYDELETWLGYGSIEELMANEEEDLVANRADRIRLEARLKEIVKGRDLAKEVYDLYGAYIDKNKELTTVYNEFLEAANRDIGNSFLKKMQSKLAHSYHALNEHEANGRLVNSLSGMITKHRDKLKAYSDIHKALNPTTGIISEQVTDYCQQFSEQVTGVIGQVWGYPMAIRPPEVGRKGLTYDFPVQFENGVSADVRKTSKSQEAIINLAVTLCTRVALGNTALPLFLDEVSEGLDEHHAKTIREFVRVLIKSNDCDNVFFVDHEAATRHQLGDYEEIVFMPGQVVTSEGYNSHVTLERY